MVIGVGGALGAVARYLLGGAVHRVVAGFFPYGTFVVNLLGCLVFGLVIGVSESRLVLGPTARAFILIGILGGLTTFSSFAFESVELVRSGQTLGAAFNVIGQVALGLLALWLGAGLGRAV